MMSSYHNLTIGKKYRSVSVAMAGKAAEHSRLPRPFCYFLGQCQKVKKEKVKRTQPISNSLTNNQQRPPI
jgi:hypothetical protein